MSNEGASDKADQIAKPATDATLAAKVQLEVLLKEAQKLLDEIKEAKTSVLTAKDAAIEEITAAKSAVGSAKSTATETIPELESLRVAATTAKTKAESSAAEIDKAKTAVPLATISVFGFTSDRKSTRLNSSHGYI